MKRHVLTLALACLAMMTAWASNTKVNGVFYDFDDATQTASVTFRGASYSSYDNEYEGKVVVPANIKHNGKIYKVNSVGLLAFSGCTTLTAVELPSTITKINGWAFDGCTSLQSVVLREGIESIGSYAFSNNKALKSIELPNSVTSVGTYAFQDCDALESVTIGEGLKNLDINLFLNSNSIKSVVLRSAVPPVYAATTFSEPALAATVSVPCGSERAYKASAWNKFAAISSGAAWKLDVESADNNQGSVKIVKSTSCTDDVAVIAADPAKGYKFQSWDDGNKENPRRVKLEADVRLKATFAAVSNKVVEKVEETVKEAEKQIAKADTKKAKEEKKEVKPAKEEKKEAKPAKEETVEQAPIVVAENKPAQSQEVKKEAKPAQKPATQPKTTTTTTAKPSNKPLEGSDGKMYAIKVTSGNSKMGSVSGGKKYLQGTEAVLEALPKEGFRFTRWQDGSVLNPRTIIVTTNAEYVADFAISQYQLDLSVDSGLNGVVVGAGMYNYKDNVTVTATPNDGYRFVKWSDGNTKATRNVKMTSDVSLVASFIPLTFDIVTSVNGDRNGNGKVEGAGTYTYNTSVSLKAVPDSGFHFVAWNDGVNTNPRVFAATKNISYEATFAPNLYALNLETEDVAKGIVKGAGEYPYKENVIFEAVPEYGYSFDKWSDGKKENPRTIIMEGNKQFTASFVINKYDIKAVSSNLSKGTVTGSGIYEYKSTAKIEATPQNGYYFVKWSDDNTDNPRSVTVTQKAEYEATFAEKVFTFNAKSESTEKGKVLGAGSYRFGSNVLLRADAENGYHFVKWDDNNTDNPRTLTVESDKELTALFDINTYTLKATVDFIDRGIIVGNGKYEFGQTATLEARPRAGYHFTHWSDGNTENPRQVVMQDNYEYQAQFDLDKFIMTATSSNNAHGKVTGSGEYLYNYTATIRAIAETGYHFTTWSDRNSENPRNISMTKDEEFEAQFEPDVFVLSVKSSDVNRGIVSGAGTFEYKNLSKITATPKNGYHFARWNDNVTDNPREISVEEDVTYTAFFEPNIYTLDVKVNDQQFGYVSGAGDYDFTSPATLRAVPSTGYQFAKWSDGNTQNPRKVTVIKHESFEAVFVPISYTLTITSGDPTKGTVSGSGSYKFQTTAMVEAKAKKGYHFLHWSDGSTQNPRNFIIKGNAAYEAVFVADRHNITVQSSDPSMGQANGSGQFEYNTSISINALPADGYRFVRWSDGSKQNPRAVTVTGDVTYTAEFEVDNSGR